MDAGTLISYFAERDEARRALRELQRRGFRRAAWVYKTADGNVHIRDPFLWRRALGATLTAILFGGLAGLASVVLHWPVPILSGSLSTLVSIFAGGLIGTSSVGCGYDDRSTVSNEGCLRITHVG